MRRIKISKLNIASISEDNLIKSIESTFDVNDNTQYGFQLKNNTGIVQIRKDHYKVSEKDIFLNDLKKVLNQVMENEFNNIPDEEFKYYAEVNKLTPLNLANTFVDNEVSNNESLIKRFGGIVDNNNNIVFVKVNSNEDLLGTQELTDENSDNVKKFRKQYINKDVIEFNQLVDNVKEDFNDTNKKNLINKVKEMNSKYTKILNEFNTKIKKETNKYIKEEFSEVIRMTTNLLNDLKSWITEINKDPELNFLNENNEEDNSIDNTENNSSANNESSLTENLNKLLSTNANKDDIKYSKNKLTIGNKTYDVYNEKDAFDFLNKKFTRELENLKKNISDDIGLDLNTEIDDNFKDKAGDFTLSTLEESPKIDFSKLTLSENEKSEIVNNYGSLGTYYFIEE